HPAIVPTIAEDDRPDFVVFGAAKGQRRGWLIAEDRDRVNHHVPACRNVLDDQAHVMATGGVEPEERTEHAPRGFTTFRACPVVEAGANFYPIFWRDADVIGCAVSCQPCADGQPCPSEGEPYLACLVCPQ